MRGITWQLNWNDLTWICLTAVSFILSSFYTDSLLWSSLMSGTLAVMKVMPVVCAAFAHLWSLCCRILGVEKKSACLKGKKIVGLLGRFGSYKTFLSKNMFDMQLSLFACFVLGCFFLYRFKLDYFYILLYLFRPCLAFCRCVLPNWTTKCGKSWVIMKSKIHFTLAKPFSFFPPVALATWQCKKHTHAPGPVCVT